ncbi:hypothetical protein OG895_22735 [Streptomyces sp. NBC_00201]|uniref:hypothetical protein n=1 Tax=unclassified Streptomyces TaxID=2593676 RepID=UPI00224FAA76|nr:MULTISPECIES: hypothetical protein [unclassified Streptomyces]MCX4882632.1 hypothetical protein [Streptomyces sp. NBC_00847]MCX5050061.1 hypothetical protein [Streptomyces sp. NBC_00474]MCX5247992.1 hypothetical protein [Streptomyces sp. NBC_00201]
MPRGRHRHSPPLHRLLPPSAIAGVSFVCAFGPWVFTQHAVLRVIAALAAATAVVGAAVMRRWDTQAGKQVADLTRARASDEWRHEERVAELETDLEESRELRAKLEQRLRSKRTELAGLRNEHAALLRRYATAETERASALEGRRLLEIEAGVPQARALPPVPVDEALAEAELAEETEAVAASVDTDTDTDTDAGTIEAAGDSDGTKQADETPADPAVFSPQGSQLFLRAKAALKRFDEDGEGSPEGGSAADAPATDNSLDGASLEEAFPEGVASDDVALEDESPANDPSGDALSESELSQDGFPKSQDAAKDDSSPDDDGSPKGDGPTKGHASRKREPVRAKAGSAATEAATATGTAPGATGAAADAGTEAATQEDEAQGQPEAVDGHERAAATTSARHAPSGGPVRRPAGHFVEPTAVAVVPAAPVRRPAVEGGFDFFGTKAEQTGDALEAVQNEDLADVVGQEALALHKAEAESEFRPADEKARAVGQVIDLTAHDETEQIDLQGLRSAAS